MSNDVQINSSPDNISKMGERVEFDIVVIKRILAKQTLGLMELENLSKTKMAARMEISRRALDRLLDPTKSTITINTLDQVARILGKKLHLELIAV